MKYSEFEEIYWAPRKKLGGGWICFKDSPSAPPAPDYAGAATQTAQGNLEAARAAANANRVNQYTPYGSLTYAHDANAGPDGGWSATQTLSPAQQGILDQNNQLNSGLMGTANKGLNYANGVLSQPGVSGYDVQKPGDFSAGAPTTGFNPGQSYQDAMMSRLSPQIDRENSQSDAQLANQGIMQGSQAYATAKTQLGQQHNDLLNNATVQGLSAGMQANQQKFGQNQSQFQAGNAANQQGFQQTAYNQMQPINVINALRTGSQVSSPSFVNAPQQQTTAGPDMMGAAQGQNQYNMGLYNSKVGSNNSSMGMLGTLGAAGVSAFSDVRLKTNIKRIGTHDSGIGIYSYTKFGMPEIGVLAQEVEKVMPHAVSTHASGFKMVDYEAL